MIKLSLRAALVGLCATLVAGLLYTSSPALKAAADTGLNWTGQYWNNTSLSGNPTVTRTDAIVNFNWGNTTPDPSVGVNNFSARWTLAQAFLAGSYTFRAGAKGSVRAYIDGNVIIDQFHDTSSFQVYTTSVTLGAGNHNLQVDYASTAAPAGVLFDWSLGNVYNSTAIPAATSTPAATATPYAIKAVVRVDQANVRSDPSTSNPPIATVYYGDGFKVVASNADGTWYLVVLADGRQGWIFRHNLYLYGGTTDNLTITQAQITPQGMLANVQAVATVPLIVRDGPSRRNTQKVGAINQGESFKVVALSRNHAWVLINASGGLTGWVFVPYINVTVGDLGNLPVHN